MLRVITGAGAIGCGMLAFGAGVALVTGVGRVDRWMPGAMLVGYVSHLLGDLGSGDCWDRKPV